MKTKQQLIDILEEAQSTDNNEKLKIVQDRLVSAAQSGDRHCFIEFHLNDAQQDAITNADLTITVLDPVRSDDPWYKISF